MQNDNRNICVDLSLGLVQETLIALRDREFALLKELHTAQDPVILEIIRRQLGRLCGAINGLEDAVEGATGYRA